MFEKLKLLELHYFEYFEILSLLAALVFYKGLVRFRLAAFVPITLIATIVDFLGVNDEVFWDNTHYIYNCYLLFTPPFYFLVFYRMLALSGKSARLYLLTAVLTELLLLVNFFFFEGPGKFNVLSSMLTSIIYIFITCMVVLKINLLDGFANERSSRIYFIICGGALLFNLGILIILGLKNVISAEQLRIGGQSLNVFLVPKLNVIMYSAYAYAFFLCRKQNRK